eukprot:SAG22_NODE_635_length_8370_cov_33.081127_7_plen_241_part_00
MCFSAFPCGSTALTADTCCSQLEDTQNRLFNVCTKLLKNESDRRFFPEDGGPAPEWTETDGEEYSTRLGVLEKWVEKAYEDSGRAEGSFDDSYMKWYPLHVSTVLYERLLARACFEAFDEEDPDYGGGLEMNAPEVVLLLKEMSSHLGFVDGMHDVCMALALHHQYQLTKQGAHLEQLQDVVQNLMQYPEALQFKVVQLQLQVRGGGGAAAAAAAAAAGQSPSMLLRSSLRFGCSCRVND